MTRSALVAALALASCSGGKTPLDLVDERYTEVMVDLGVADRDTSRNVHNREARKRKVAAEKARVAFFREPGVISAIDEAAKSSDPATVAKAEAYKRHLISAASWTEDEKAEESRLLGRLDELRSAEATWTSSDGTVEADLTRGWVEASKSADGLDDAVRRDLAKSYVEHRMHVAGEDLQALVRLRNEVARRAGYATYWELSLASHGLSPEDVSQIIDELEPVVAPINLASHDLVEEIATRSGVEHSFANEPMLRRRAGLEAGHDEADAYFDTDRAEERITTAFHDMGIATEGWQIYSGPTRYVRPGVYGFPVRPPEHVAIVMSQDQRFSMWQYEALAHEGGHAMWWNVIAQDVIGCPPLWDPPAPWFEGFAQIFERMSYDPGFTARYVPELPDVDREKLADWRARDIARLITDSIIETLVEQRLYENPDDLLAITRFGSEKRAELFLSPTAPVDERGLIYEPALLQSMLWNYPAYNQNYLFAYMTEAWLYAAVVEKVGDPVANDKVGPFLRDNVVRMPWTTPFPDRLAALLPGDRTAPLKAYLKMPDPLPAQGEATAEGGE